MMDTSGSKSAKAMDAGDRISGLPDELRHHVLSFLPARNAVRTCVLSPKWHHLWASARRLNVDAEGFTSQRRFTKFVNALLLSRGCAPLESFWLRANGPGIFLENFRETAYLWICHALRSNVEELGIVDHDHNDTSGDVDDPEIQFFRLEHCPITSSYLKKLHLCYVDINNHVVKKLFSGCPALEDLEMINCEIDGTEFSSATLKNLSIDYVHFPYADNYDYDHDIVINMPSLVSLHIGALLRGVIASLVDVQSLRTASFYLDAGCYTFAEACNILGALSNVKNLEFLPSVYGRCSLQTDMLWCQVTFTNLTTLSLSDLCLHDNCKVLLYLLDHSPNLEELTLKMRKPVGSEYHAWSSSAAAVDSPCEETVEPLNCAKLKKVEIICPKGDKRVGMLVTILLSRIISPPEISIKPFSGLSWADDLKWTRWS